MGGVVALNILNVNINKYEQRQCNQLAGTILFSVLVLAGSSPSLLFTPLVLFAYLWTRTREEFLKNMWKASQLSKLQPLPGVDSFVLLNHQQPD